MKSIINKNKLTKFIATLVIAAQLAITANFAIPQKAEALFGVGDFTFSTTIGNPYDILKDIGLAATKRIALNYANRFLTRFVDKLQDKYRIRNFLYYEEVLTSHLLTNFIYDRVQDPDLREVYTILEKVYISGTATGYKKNPDPSKALIPQLKKAVRNVYIKQTGIDPDFISSPPATADVGDYLTQAQAFYWNSPANTQANLQANLNRYKLESNTAAQLEILVGNGIKAGRIIGGTCSGASGAIPGQADPKSSRLACEAAGGTWNASVLDAARAVINNPSFEIDKFMSGAIDKILGNNYDANNSPWTAIGSALGNFVFRKLNLNNESGSIVNEYNLSYTGDTGDVPIDVDLDLDADGIPDGQDLDKNGTLDVCYHGGTPSTGCKNSRDVTNSPYFTPLCRSMSRAVTNLQEYMKFIVTYKDHFDGDNLKNKADADIWGRRSMDVSSSIDDLLRTIEGFNKSDWDKYEIAIGQYSSYISTVVESLIKDKDLDLARFGNGDGGIDGLIKNTQATLAYMLEVQRVIVRCDAPKTDAVVTVAAPEIIDVGGGGGSSGGGACSYLLTEGAGIKDREVQLAMEAVLPDFADLPADTENISAYRDAVVDYLNENGEEAARGHNGNCNSSANNLAIRVDSTKGEMYDMVRTGRNCADTALTTIEEHVDPCRLPPGGFTGRWSYVGEGKK